VKNGCGEPKPFGHVIDCVSATGCQPVGTDVHVEAIGVQLPQVPVASQVCIPPALHVVALPHVCVVFGTHVPAHAPMLHTLAQGVPFCHWPAMSQVCGTFNAHPVVPGTQIPPHAPPTHALGH